MSKVVWITGVSRGLGRELAKGMAEAGWTVAGCARSEEKVQSLADELGGDHFFQAVDVCSEDGVKEFTAAASATVGSPDLLVNNAAIINDPAPLWKVSEEEFAQVLEINIGGVTRCIRVILPLVLQQGSGVIANLSSGWGRSTSPDVAPYCATKWAIEGLSQALAQELPSGLASVAVNPGVIDTEMLRQTWNEGAAGFETADQWAVKAVPFFAGLTASDNGKSLTVS